MLAGGTILRDLVARYLPVTLAVFLLVAGGAHIGATFHELREAKRELAWVRGRLLEKRELVRQQQQEIAQIAGVIERVATTANGAREREVRLRRLVHLEESHETIVAPPWIESTLDGGGSSPSLEGARALASLASLEEQTASLSASVTLLTALSRQSREQGDGLPSRWPVRGSVSSEFGYRSSPESGALEFHGGVDIRSGFGTKVTSTGGGEVVFAGSMSGYGKMVVVDHGHDVKTIYAHLSDIAVDEGGHVKRGEIVGRVGTSGRSTGPHLHYEIRIGGNAVDPTCYLNAPPQHATRPLTLTTGG